VNRAIVLLGLSAVKNVAIAASMARLFQGGKLSEQFDAKDLWTHSIAVAVTSRLLHQAQGKRAGSEEAFLAGLIHDLGLLIEKQAFDEKLMQVVAKVEREKCNFCETEIEIIGADHQSFGHGLATKWQFPRHLRAVAGYHHNVENLAEDVRELPIVVHIADLMVCQMQLGFWLTAHDAEFNEEILPMVNLTMDQLRDVQERIPEELEAAQAVMGMSS
jgi:HD-like signal output (HDOD) protein